MNGVLLVFFLEDVLNSHQDIPDLSVEFFLFVQSCLVSFECYVTGTPGKDW